MTAQSWVQLFTSNSDSESKIQNSLLHRKVFLITKSVHPCYTLDRRKNKIGSVFRTTQHKHVRRTPSTPSMYYPNQTNVPKPADNHWNVLKILRGGHVKAQIRVSSSRSLLFTVSVTVLSAMFLFSFRYKSFLTVWRVSQSPATSASRWMCFSISPVDYKGSAGQLLPSECGSTWFSFLLHF